MGEIVTHLELEPQIGSEVIDHTPNFLLADSIPELHFSRIRARHEAHEILEQNRQLHLEGRFDEAPIPVDAGSTARKVLEAQKAYGENSEEAQLLWQGLVLDCIRIYAEARHKRGKVYFPPVEQHFITEAQGYFSNGLLLADVTKQGLSAAIDEPEELEYRLNDYVEEATHVAVHKAMGNLGIKDTVKIMTISQCTDWAIEAWQNKSKNSFGGFVPEIEKLMIRDVTFEAESTSRYEEQVGMPGTYVTPEVILEALRRRQIEGLKTKTEVHAAQLMHNDDLFDFVALLDEVASEFSGQEIFMGEALPEGQARDYEKVRQEGIKQHDNLQADAEDLAHYVLDLERQGTDRWLTGFRVEEYVADKLFEVAKHDISQAAVIFDDKTADGLKEVQRLVSLGRIEEANNRLDKIREEAPPVSYCGAGSCGLETVSASNKITEVQTALKLLHVNGVENLVYDTERGCKSCNSKSVYYNIKNGDKACASCGTTELNGQLSKTDLDKEAA